MDGSTPGMWRLPTKDEWLHCWSRHAVVDFQLSQTELEMLALTRTIPGPFWTAAWSHSWSSTTWALPFLRSGKKRRFCRRYRLRPSDRSQRMVVLRDSGQFGIGWSTYLPVVRNNLYHDSGFFRARSHSRRSWPRSIIWKIA